MPSPTTNLLIIAIHATISAVPIDYPRYSRDATYKKAPKSRKAVEEQIPLRGEIDESF